MDFNELPAHVWPRNSRREEDGVVTVAGVPLTDCLLYTSDAADEL